MKKKTKIIISISILLILIAIGVYFYQFGNYTGTIREIIRDFIYVEVPDQGYYYFRTKDVVIKNSKGHKINFSDIKVGDQIHIINKKPYYKDDSISSGGGYSITHLDNVKVIKVLDK